MKDFPKLEFLRVWFCALWTWESLKIANNFRASVLDLDVSTDIHFQVGERVSQRLRTRRLNYKLPRIIMTAAPKPHTINRLSI